MWPFNKKRKKTENKTYNIPISKLKDDDSGTNIFIPLIILNSESNTINNKENIPLEIDSINTNCDSYSSDSSSSCDSGGSCGCD